MKKNLQPGQQQSSSHSLNKTKSINNAIKTHRSTTTPIHNSATLTHFAIRLIASCAIAFGLGHAAFSASPTGVDNIATQHTISNELRSHRGHSFETLLDHWAKDYGAKAYGPLLNLAAAGADTRLDDSSRYIALMAASRIGGQAIEQSLNPFFIDSSWKIRSAALRISVLLSLKSKAPQIIALVDDPALVVRMEAVHAIQKLKLTQAIPRLSLALVQPANYQNGKALWIPARIIASLQLLLKKSPAETAGYLGLEVTTAASRPLAQTPGGPRLHPGTVKPEIAQLPEIEPNIPDPVIRERYRALRLSEIERGAIHQPVAAPVRRSSQ